MIVLAEPRSKETLMDDLYGPVEQAGVILDGLDIGWVVEQIQENGYAVVEDFLETEAIASIRAEFNSDLPITELRGIGTDTGRSWRSHNLLGKTRVADSVFLDRRLRAIVEGEKPY